MNRSLLAAAALLLAACSTGPTTVGLRLNEPSAIVAYNGIAPAPGGKENTVVRPLLAVASRRGDELRLIDPTVDQPIFGPGIVYPLSIPTAPRPQLLASASLGDGGADLLVAVSAGSTSLQVIETWTQTSRVAFEVLLDGVLGAGAEIEILSVLGIPGNTGDGKARLLVGVTGARLVVVDFSRSGDEVVLGTPLVPAPVVQLLNSFDAVDMALLPPPPDLASAKRTVFLASRDRVGGSPSNPVYGVGVIDDAAADPSVPFTITAIDARASTVAVAAAWVSERQVNSADPCGPYKFGDATPRVYAALDESRCGPDQSIACGIATLDPLTGKLAQDLWLLPVGPATPDGKTIPAQGYRTPMPVFGVPLHIAVGYAPAKGAERFQADLVLPTGCSPPAAATPVLRLQPTAGSLYTNAVAMVSSSDGRVYWYDLSRSAPVSEVSAVSGGSRTGVTSASTAPLTAGTWALGLWSDVSGAVAGVTADPALLPLAIETWPGFTDRATWSLTYQGGLPRLQRRAGVIANIGGKTFAAFQTRTADGTGWTVVAKVADPELGVHPSATKPDQDLLELPDRGCVVTITKVLPAGATELAGVVPFDGGAVQIVDDPTVPCLPAAMEGVPVPALLTVRASGLVLVNDHSGYMGRPVIDETFTLAWADETTLQGEDLALARKARRIFYPLGSPCPIPGAAAGTQGANLVSCYDGFPRLVDPLSPGPALRLRPGLTFVAEPGVTPGPPFLVRDATVTPTLTFATTNGLIPTSREPASGGALPSGIAVVDPTKLGLTDLPVRFYVPYADDQLFEFTAAGTTSQVTSLR